MKLELNGHSVYIYTGGKPFDPKRRVVVFVHGAQADHSVWILQSRYLAHHGFSVLAVDMPGHGASAGAPIATVADMAGWLIALLKSLQVSAATLVGHSIGSLIALQATGQAPALVAGLVLVGTAFPMRVSDALLQAAQTDEAKAFDMINSWSHSSLTHHPGCPGPGFSVFVQQRRLMERQQKGALYNDFAACNAYAQGFERAQAAQCPSLFILGRNDIMTPAKAGRALAAKMRNATVVEIDRCGHSLTTERPDAVLTALKPFLELT